MQSILIITARADWGGGPEHVYCLLQNLCDTIEIFIACPQEFPYWDRYGGILGEERMFEIPHRKFKISFLWKLRVFVKKNGIEAIHSHGKGAGLYGRLLSLIAGVPCIHTFHGIHLQEYHALKRKAYIWIERQLSRLSSQIIAVSKGEAEQIKDLNLCNMDKLQIIPNGVRIPGILPAMEDKQNQNIDRVHKLIHITRFEHVKNFDLLFQIWKILEKTKLAERFQIIILGDGKDRRRFQHEVENRNWQDKFLFLGAVKNVNEYLQDCFCYLSTSRWEGMPLAVLEAMAMGLPVIATDVVGNRDVVDDGKTGFLYNLDRPEEAVSCLNTLVNNEQHRQALGCAARDKVQREYSAECMAQQTAKLYEKIFGLKDDEDRNYL